MSKFDYYKVLELGRECSQEDIAESYRRLSLKNHPKLSKGENTAKSEYNFQKLGEAYEVLSDCNLRRIYDIYGDEGLENGIIDSKGNFLEGYKFSGNGHEIFERFMGTSNPFALVQDIKKEEGSTTEASNINIEEEKKKKEEEEKKKDKKDIKQLPPIDYQLECTLEELYNGTTKEIKYKKNSIGFDGRSKMEKESIIEIEIAPGYDKTTIIPFKEMGNEEPGKKTSDLLIHIQEKEHPYFRRVNKNDLIYTHTLTLAEALYGETVQINTLDNRIIYIAIDEIINPKTVKIVKGEGMPIYRKEVSVNDMDVKKGNLFIKFNIVFPEVIDPEKKERIIKLLNNDEN